MSCLSDDENNEKISQGSGPEGPPPIPRQPARGFLGQMPAENLNTADPRKLSYLIRGKCGCKCKCFLPFQHDPLLRRWVALRKTMSQMTKLEKDNHVPNSVISYIYSISQNHKFYCSVLSAQVALSLKVFGMLKDQREEACRGSRHLHIWEQPVCNKGFQKMMGVGKKRFSTLNTAARNGEEHPPYDGRCVKRGKKLVPSATRDKIYDFLMQLYQQVAEHIPDGLNSNKRPRQGEKKLDRSDIDRTQIKHLPFASISDYYRQCVEALGGMRVSRKLFCSDTRNDSVVCSIFH